jgi:hypothetical protein
MKSSSPDKPLRAALTRRAALVTELENLTALSADTTARLAKLESECDLLDAEALTEISRLQTIAELLPRRAASKEQQIAEATGAILTECHSLVQKHLGPTVRRIEAHTRERVRNDLRPHFGDEIELEQAVDKSSTIQEVNELGFTVRLENPTEPEQVLKYAERLLAAFDRLSKLDKLEPAAVVA